MKYFVTREEAKSTLIELIDSGVLDLDIEDKLTQIYSIIDAEQVGYHVWGADNDVSILFVARRSDLITEEYIKEVEEVKKKYSFVPAPYESANGAPLNEVEAKQ